MKRQAFTLIELIVTAVLFAIVAGYAVVIFGVSAGAGEQAQRSASVAGSTRAALDTIGTGFARSVATNPPGAWVFDLPTQNSSILIFMTTLADGAGRATATTEMRAYCPVIVNSKQRLGLFTVTTAVGSPAVNVAGVPTGCTAPALTPLFVAGATVTFQSYLTDSTTNVLSFKAAETEHDTGSPTINETATPVGIRLLMTSVFDRTVSDPTTTSRADSVASSPITVQLTASRNFPYGVSPFSGL